MKTEDVRVRDYDRNLTLLREYRNGNREAGCTLAEINTPLVYNIARRFVGRGVEFDELCEAGNIGLVKAMNTFDFERGCAFSTYAVPLIFGEIRRFLRDDGIVKVSRAEKRLSATLLAERERRLALGERVDVETLAKSVGISPADAAAALFSASSVRSLEEEASGEDGRSLGETVFDDEQQSRHFEHLALAMALEGLTEFERRLIILRYFRDLSQVQVARIMGLSQVKVSRTERKVLMKLRAQMEE